MNGLAKRSLPNNVDSSKTTKESKAVKPYIKKKDRTFSELSDEDDVRDMGALSDDSKSEVSMYNQIKRTFSWKLMESGCN